MSNDYKDMVSINCATVGTGSFLTSGAAVSGYKDFSGLTNGATYEYEALEGGSNREVGYGVYNSAAHTLTRNVLASTNSNTVVNFAGSEIITLVVASRALARFEGKQDAIAFPSDATKFLDGTAAFSTPPGSQNGSWIFIEEQVASGSASLNFANTISSKYDEYIFEFINVVPATNATYLTMRCSTNGGSSYDSSSIYDYTEQYSSSGNANSGGGSENSSSSIIFGTLSNTSAGGVNGTGKLFDPASTTSNKVLRTSGSAYVNDSHYYQFDSASIYKNTSAINAIQFLMQSGNITSGKIRSYGVLKTAGVQSSVLYPTFTTPIDANYAWVNQGGATNVVNANGGIAINAPASASASLRIRKKSLPGGNYTLQVGFMPTLIGQNFLNCGLCIRDSASSKIIAYSIFGDGTFGDNGPVYQQWTNETTFSSSTVFGGPGWQGGMVWMQLVDNGTNRIWSIGRDGYNYPITLLTESRTNFLTANEAGFFANSQNATYGCGITLFHWNGV